MLNAVIRFALQYRVAVVGLCLVALGYGSYSATQMPIDVFPDLDRPRVVVMTEAIGYAAEEVEPLVTYPLESSLLGANGVQAVRSQSGPGLSVIYVEFDWNMDIRVARQIVKERLDAVQESLPEGVRPQLAPISSIMGQVVIAGLSRQTGPNGGDLTPVGTTGLMAERVSNSGTPQLFIWRPIDRHRPGTWQSVPAEKIEWAALPDGKQRVQATIEGEQREAMFLTEEQRRMALRTTADWVIRPSLLKVSGVAQVMVLGGGRKQYQVLVDPPALTEHQVTLQDVEAALRANNVNFSGGFTQKGDVERPIRVLGRLGPRAEQVLSDLRRLPVKYHPDRTILLEQVARVTEGPQLPRGDGTVNGVAGIVLTITKQPHVDTRDLTARIEASMRETESSMPPDIVIEPNLYQLRTFIDTGVFNVGEALAIGAVLVLIVLFLFLLNFRTTLISLTAIPLSLAVTVLVFQIIGRLTGTEMSINVMTLGGIAVAMGELVDDAIVDVENIFRRLRENAALPEPRSPLIVIYHASLEVRTAIVFGTAMVVLVFLPLFALTGVEGRLFTPLGVAYVVSILASLLVSLTVTPVMSYYLLGRSRALAHHGDGFVVRFLKKLATPLIRFSMRFAGPLVLLSWIVAIVLASKVFTMKGNFLPEFDEGSVQLNVSLPPGSSLAASNQATGAIDKKLKAMQATDTNPRGEVLRFVRRTGRAELDEHASPPNETEILVTVNPASGVSRNELLNRLEADLKSEVPGAEVQAQQPLAHLISHMISGTYAQIAIKIYGDDLDTLRRTAEQIKAAIADVPGITNPLIDPIQRVEELHIRLKADRLAFYGIDRAFVGKFVETALQGEVVSPVLEGERRFDLLVRLEETYRTDYANLGRLRLRLPDQRQIMLSEVADIGPGTGASQIQRENARRRIIVRCNARDRPLQAVVSDVESRVRLRVSLPEGYSVDLAGEAMAQRKATYRILGLAIVALVGMFVVLLLLYPSVRVAMQILNAVPTAFIGGALALILTDQKPNIATWVGFISLGGIAARNGILLVTHYFHLMREEGESFSQNMILRGSLERLSPVLMTALTAGIGLLPLAVAGQQPGREILYPVATIILGGLITSTFCEFLIHPGLFWRFTGRDVGRLLIRSDGAEGLKESPA